MKKVIINLYDICNFYTINNINIELQLLNMLYVSCKKNNIENKCLEKIDIDFSNLIIRPYFDFFLNKYKTKYNFYILYYNDDNYYELYEQLKIFLNNYFQYNFIYITEIKNNDYIYICTENYKNNFVKNIIIEDNFKYSCPYNIIAKIKQ